MNSDIKNLVKIDSGRICPICGAHLYEQKMFGFVYPMMCECELERRKREREEFEQRKRQERIEQLKKESGIPKRQKEKTFDNFVPRKGTKGILSVCRQYADNFPNVDRGLLLIGEYGSGKTHLATAIANAALDKGCSVRWITAKQIYDQCKGSMADFTTSEDDFLRPLKKCKLLVIDDVGTTPPTEYAKTVFHSIIDERMNDLRQTIMTSNLSVANLSNRLDGRTMDRIPEGFDVYTWNAPSYRHKENREEKQ